MANPYEKYLQNLGVAQQQTGDFFGELLSGTQGSKKDVADRYALMGENLRRMSETASGQALSGYGAARQRVQASPTAYTQPTYNATAVGQVPMVGADARTVSGLQTAAQQGLGAEQAAISQLYSQLAASDAANRASRMMDIDVAQTSDLSQLAALAQGQQFGMEQARMRELSDLDAAINQIQRDQIAANLGFGEQELAATQGQVNFDTASLQQSVDIFNKMVDPIADAIDPESLIKLWMAFSTEIGMPAGQAAAIMGQI